jgi:hypothetical protein
MGTGEQASEWEREAAAAHIAMCKILLRAACHHKEWEALRYSHRYTWLPLPACLPVWEPASERANLPLKDPFQMPELPCHAMLASIKAPEPIFLGSAQIPSARKTSYKKRASCGGGLNCRRRRPLCGCEFALLVLHLTGCVQKIIAEAIKM